MTSTPLDLDNIQGDILVGLLKKTETFYFFQISDDVNAFRTQLSQLAPLITSTTAAMDHRKTVSQSKKDALAQGREPPVVPIAGLNIAFSQSGLTKMGITGDIGDVGFKNGQLADALALGDQGSTVNGKFVPDWIPAFKNAIHGVMIFSGDKQASVDKTLAEVSAILRVGAHDATIHEVLKVVGAVRPENGHEHFGFLDGISNPAVEGFDIEKPGQGAVDPKVILTGHDAILRPAWATDGSFLAFRYLFQLVPEFNLFLKKNPLPTDSDGNRLTPEQGSELLGARMVGRWKSGAPVDLTPIVDDPVLGKDPMRNNDFHYNIENDFTSQSRCPFAAHTRKTNPRNDLRPEFVTPHRIIRRGVPFGPEVTPDEAQDNRTHLGRGLLFACYQSNLANGFQFVQKQWANARGFPPKSTPPGIDPIIGQLNPGDVLPRSMSGTNPASQDELLGLPIWVVPRGGEYFFSPSISALRDTFALGVHIH
ncbi:dyp-type peroxidase [Meripilus lineatus]|uniref:Dyp-type peroxidase n=1 Tax=Meripilus lineatus TaxID=2056292 RepID=A0AAD5UZI5_9APHY|nr:dyp-type peroxidase [Physisporinus lineatus]